MRIKITVALSLFCVSLLLLSSSSVVAQVSEKEKQEKEAERKQQLQRQAYVLVEEIANGALSLKLPENRSYILAAAADLLWDHDEPRARNLFWDAVNTLNLMVTPASNESREKGSKPSAKEKERAASLYYEVFALRQRMLRQVARRNPQFALDMLRSSRQPELESPSPGFLGQDDRELEQQIAAEVAARDPVRALQLARESLAKGLSFQLFDLLYRLNQKDAELGTKFAGDIIDKLRGRNLATDMYGGRTAISLLTFSRAPTPPNVAPEKVPHSARWSQLKLTEDQRRDLVEMITNAALSGGANGNLLFGIDEVMPEIEQFTPERVGMLQRKLAAFNQTLNKEQKLSGEYNSLYRNGTPEEMLKLASQASDDDREWMQHEAVVMAVMRKRAGALREFVNTEIEDEGRRKVLLDTLDGEQIDYAVNKGNAEELRKLLPTVRLKEQRARAMAEIAIVMEKNGGHDEALKLLDEAQTMIKTDLNSETQTNALLTLVAGYALVEPGKAFSIVERVIDRANDEIAKALLLDKIAGSGAVKKGEIKLQQYGMMPVDFAVFKYGKGVAALANADFDRTKAAADRFQKNELRLMVRLLLVQALLRSDSSDQAEARP
ncbi:MAG TPA: hypothetical protein VGO73_03135 [Pyrinomonadaceae bacterium]|jgi:hypothetical protein|nr:hypothetical protein [Pyrinomonadaceae bacterium]